MFDVARVRGLYPTLGGGVTHLDGGYGALQPESVISAIITTLRRAPSQPGSRSARSMSAANAVEAARLAVADLVGATPDSVVLGGNLATLTVRFADLLAPEWELADEIVLNRLEHDANVRPWLAAARSVGVTVRWAEVDVETGELPDWQYDRLINKRTRLVTLPLANPITGTLPDVRAIADRAHEVGALVVVDAGSALPHVPIELIALGADLIGISAQGFGGPTIAAIVARPGLLREMESDTPGPIPECFELGALPIELLGGLTAAVDHLAGLDESATGSRRDRVVHSLEAAGAYEHEVYLHLDTQLRAIPAVTVIGSSTDRVPVLAFTVNGYRPGDVGDYLARRGISVWTGDSGLTELMRTLGVDELGGAVQVGLMPHSTKYEVDQLVAGVAALIGFRR